MKRAIIGILALLLFVPMGSHAETGEQESIRGVQDMLKECGFNPGPIDGLWGNRTAKAAKDYIRAHGGSPQSEKNLIVAQVDGYRVGDDGPCPNPPKVAHEDDMPLESKGGAGEDNPLSRVDFAKKGKSGAASAIAEIQRILDGRRSSYRSSYIDYANQKLEVMGDVIRLTGEVQYKNEEYMHLDWRGVAFTYTHKMKLSDIGDAVDYGSLHIVCIGQRLCVQETTDRPRMTQVTEPNTPTHYIDIQGHVWGISEQDMKNLSNAVKQLGEHNRSGTTDKPAKCLEWVELGSITPGAWVNGNGRRTEAMRAGDDGKAYDDKELWEHYEKAHRECKTFAERALDAAFNAMVLVGRKAVDVDNEKRAIRDYFQNRLSRCQAEFKNRYVKYANKFCK